MSDPRQLIDALRRVMSASRTADLAELDLDAEVAQLDAIAAKLATASVDEPRMQAALRESEMAARMAASAPGARERVDRARENGLAEFFPYSPVVGPLNPVAPPVELEVVDDGSWAELHGVHHFDPIHNGPPGGVHGGIIAAVIDELLGSVCVVNDVAGFTGTLELRYRSLTPLDVPIRMRAWVDRVEGRKTFAKGTFHHGDTLCVEADGIFIGFDPFVG